MNRFPTEGVQTMCTLGCFAHKSFATVPILGCDITLHRKVSSTDGKVLSRAARYHHPIGSKGRGLCPHLLKGILKNPLKKPKTFMAKRIDFLPRVCEHCAPSVVLLIKVLLSVSTLGATSPCMGKSRPQTERYCREPLGATTLSAL